MKVIGFSASILNNTNKVVSSTESDWSGIREGAFFKFSTDNAFHTVAKTEQTFYIKEFEIESRNRIRINDDVGINLAVLDNIVISYKEMQIVSATRFINAGKGYKAGDHLNLIGGVPSVRIEDNSSESGVIMVLEVDDFGAIVKYQVKNRGRYLEPPAKICNVANGSGSGAVVEVEYNVYENRAMLDRQVESMEISNGKTTLTLNYSLPNGVNSGKLSVDKWILYLTTPYTKGDKLAQKYDVTADYTPHYQLPLLARNSFSVESIHNQALIMLDNKIRELEERIQRLEKV